MAKPIDMSTAAKEAAKVVARLDAKAAKQTAKPKAN
jgi:hypothetical protein